MGIKLNLRGTRLTADDVESEAARRPSALDAGANNCRRKSVTNMAITSAREITTHQSIIPIALVTVSLFMRGFCCGLLDVLNKNLQ